MEEVVNFVDKIKSNSQPKGQGSLPKVNLGEYRTKRLVDPFFENAQKRDLIVNDSLLNEKNFISYWKAREKHRNPADLAYQIQLGSIDDVDHDGFDEHVAYYNDGTNNFLMGYNQYALSAPLSSQKKAKATYYRKSASERQNESYADFLASNPEAYLGGFTDEETIKKYKESLDKKLITKVKNFFKVNNGGIYNALKPKDKTAIANAFIQITAEAMIDDNANRAKAAVVKGLKGFVEAKKALVEKLINDDGVKAAGGKIIEQIISGNAASVEAYIQKLAGDLESTLTAVDIDDLYTFAMQNRYAHSLVAKVPTFNPQTHESGYNAWMAEKYPGGHTPANTAKHNFLA